MISHDVTCELCQAEIEVALHEGSDGNPDIESSTCCPPSDSFCEPDECPECGHPILVEDMDELIVDHRVGQEEWKAEQMQER